MLSKKSTISQKLKIAQKTLELNNSFQIILHLLRLKKYIFLAKWLKKCRQTFLESGHTFMKGANCAKTNEKNLVYEIWSILYSKF